MEFKNIKRYLLGDPMATEMMHNERITKWKALAVLSSDALSSVAYATEEVLIPLSVFATAAVAWSIPIAISIAVLLLVVTVSYRQTIDAYPSGGGAYIVARENLGETAGLVAAAALLIDYVLTVAVSVSAGIENIASAFPIFLPHKALLDVVVIALIMVMNLRGVRESANIFALPTYLFIFSFIVMIGAGIWQLANGLAPMPPTTISPGALPAIPLFLLLKAFSSGCVALTGIEAISNGIPIFREPAQRNAKITMAWMSFILGAFFLAITLLSRYFAVTPVEGETAVSLLARQIFGSGVFYYVVQASTTLILILAANTSYADFPRLASLLANDRYLPRQLASLGDRLVFSNGIGGLSLAAVFLVVIFGGDTHLLIPLYAVGVFLSFSLSQAGMVMHHLRLQESGWKKSLFFNALGALTTTLVLCVIGSTKFMHGAWVVVLLIPVFVLFFKQIHKHYIRTAKKLCRPKSTEIPHAAELKHTAVLPLSGVHQGVIDSLSYALSISKDVRAIYVELNPAATQALKLEWQESAANVPLIVLASPYRSVISPVVKYIEKVVSEKRDNVVTVIIPEFVTTRWYHQLLHNQTALLLRLALRGHKDVIVTSVRYHLDDD